MLCKDSDCPLKPKVAALAPDHNYHSKSVHSFSRSVYDIHVPWHLVEGIEYIILDSNRTQATPTSDCAGICLERT
jgi:hypothetical protein